MSWKTDLATGAGAVIASDFLAPKMPDAIDFGGLPVRKYGGAVLGAYGASWAAGQKLSWTHAAIRGIAALAAAELKTCYLPTLGFAVAGIDLGRVAAGAAGAYAGRRFGG